MKHKDVIDEIEKFIFFGTPLSNDAIAHIEQCLECKNYYEKALKFNEGLKKLRDVSSNVSSKINLDTKKIDLLSTKKKVGYLSFLVFTGKIRKILITFSIALIILISSFLVNVSIQDYWSNSADEVVGNASMIMYDTVYSGLEKDEVLLEEW